MKEWVLDGIFVSVDAMFGDWQCLEGSVNVCLWRQVEVTGSRCSSVIAKKWWSRKGWFASQSVLVS